MIQTLKTNIYRNGYLLITAAWLYTLSFIFTNYLSYTSSPDKVKQSFEKFIKTSEEKFVAVTKDTATIKTLIAENSKAQEDVLQDNLESYFIYTKNDIGNNLLTFWNTNIVVPQAEDLQKNDGKYFVKYSNGEFEFLKKTIWLKGKEITIAGMVPIRWNYFWNNKYLKTQFAAFDELDKRYEVDTSSRGFNININNGDGKILFKLKEKPKDKIDYSYHNGVPLTLRVFAILFLMIFINFLAYDTVRKVGWLKGFSLLFVIIILLRFLSYKYDFPFDFRKLELFDPSIYASNILHPSLGDLLINVILVFWVASFLKYVTTDRLKEMKTITGNAAKAVLLVLCMLLVLFSFICSEITRSLIIDSIISFDVANFFSLNIYTVLSFIILCLIILSFFNLSHLILLVLKRCNINNWWKYVFVAVLGLCYLTLRYDQPSLSINLFVLVWLLLYLLLLEYRPQDLVVPFMRSTFVLVWLVIFAASISSLIIYQNRIVELEQRKRIAEKLAMQTDPSGESLMSLAVDNFSNNFLSANFHRFSNENSNKFIKDSLINENFSGYLNKYDTRIYTFDSAHNPLYNDDSASYDVITNIIYNQSKKTKIKDLYYFENSLDRFSYLYQNQIKSSSGNIRGYFFVVAKPKRYKSDALYPELFKQVKDISTDLNVNYAYAIYNKQEILVNYGDYNFSSRLSKEDLPHIEYEVKTKDDYNILWYNAGNNKVVIIVRKGTVLYELITLFAYMFGSFLFIVLLFHLGNLLFRSRFRWNKVKSALNLSIRSQIQSTIIFISVFSFVVIGAATISFYITRYNKSNRERLVKAITIMADEIHNQLTSHAIFDDVVKIYDLGANSELESSISEVAEIHNVDVNFYDLNGVLKVSTQPYIYNKHILSEMMEPSAYYKLHYNKEIQVIQDERVGKFKYVSIYVPIRDANNNVYAYLNIPYLNSQSELNQEISNFLVTLINLNAFIFVLAGVIALLLTHRITNSFSLIADKMKAINIGKYNEEIKWNSNDEIGTLVNEYNKMVKKLEQSAEALAKSEREGAWREMARQVAHEIKNPLTPMKLSIQYLQRSIEADNPGTPELAKKVSATLIEQIDELAKIASDFSEFANIGNVRTEVFDISTVLSSLVNLHSSNNKVEIIWERIAEPILINADKTQVKRLFTNLLQNAIEASVDNHKAVITIVEEVRDKEVLVSITDEGMGIPSSMHDKIFIPNFTTKTSGTGLGLAICKGIMEKANGKIWFTTEENKGTTFFVLFPLAVNA